MSANCSQAHYCPSCFLLFPWPGWKLGPKQGKCCRNWSWHLPAGGCFGGFYSTASAGSFFFFSISISAMKAFTCHQALRMELGSSATAPWAPRSPLGVWGTPGAPCSPLEPWDPNRPPPAPLLPSVSQGKEGRGTRERIQASGAPLGALLLSRAAPTLGAAPPVAVVSPVVLGGTELGT